MLSRPSKFIAKRFASAARATGTVQDRVSVLNNGLSVSSVELNGAASSLVLAFRAGSRYQPADQQGLVHLIRNSIGRDSNEFPGLSLVWNTAASGGNIKAVSDRDILAIELNVVRDNVDVALSILGQLGSTAFKPWDVEDVKGETLRTDSTYLTGTATAFELLHQAAFRNGSLGLTNYSLNNISAKNLAKFANERLVTGDAVLVGVNVDHDVLVNSASQQFPLREGSGKPSSENKYFGGEVRKSGPGNSTHVAIAGEGSGLKSAKDAAVQAVVAQIFINAAKNVTSDAISVNVNYQDSGLVGVQFTAKNSNVAAVTKNVVSAIRSANVKSIDQAKNEAALNVLNNSQQASNVALSRASQVLAGADTQTPSEFANEIKNVTSEQVSQALSRASGKLSLAAFGTPALVPYLDEI